MNNCLFSFYHNFFKHERTKIINHNKKQQNTKNYLQLLILKNQLIPDSPKIKNFNTFIRR